MKSKLTGKWMGSSSPTSDARKAANTELGHKRVWTLEAHMSLEKDFAASGFGISQEPFLPQLMSA